MDSTPATVVKPRILIVEDEAIVARDIQQHLVALGYEPVGLAMRGEEAITMAGELRPDLVLTDVHLGGGLDGISAAHAIRTQFSLPVVFLTAFAEDDTLARARLTEPFGYILKPFSERELRTAIEMALYKHKAEARLRESEARYRAVIESASGAIITANSAGNIVGWNSGAERMFGYREAEVSGQPVTLLMPARYHDRHLTALARAGSGGEHHTLRPTVELEGQRKDGREFPVSLSRSVWQVADGTYFTAIVHDITERKQTEEELRESAYRLRKAQELGQMGGWEWNIRTGTMAWSEEVFRIFGLPPGPSVPPYETILRMVPADSRERLSEAVESALTYGRALEGEYEVIRPDGTFRNIYTVGEVVREADGMPVKMFGMIQDVTARKQAEDVARIARADAERVDLLRRLAGAQEAERRRIGRELHDLVGQQMTALRLQVERLKVQCGERREWVEGVDTMETLVRQLDRDVDVVIRELRPAALDDLGLSAALKNHIQRWSQQVGIPVHLHESGLDGARLPVDVEFTLYRVAQEALTNVAKHARATQVDIVLEYRAGQASLFIEDDGVGFDPAEQPVVGLGLRGMSERVAQVGATLEIESAPGNGTSVIVRLPAILSTRGGG